jgi:hypothetical protein
MGVVGDICLHFLAVAAALEEAEGALAAAPRPGPMAHGLRRLLWREAIMRKGRRGRGRDG